MVGTRAEAARDSGDAGDADNASAPPAGDEDVIRAGDAPNEDDVKARRGKAAILYAVATSRGLSVTYESAAAKFGRDAKARDTVRKRANGLISDAEKLYAENREWLGPILADTPVAFGLPVKSIASATRCEKLAARERASAAAAAIVARFARSISIVAAAPGAVAPGPRTEFPPLADSGAVGGVRTEAGGAPASAERAVDCWPARCSEPRCCMRATSAFLSESRGSGDSKSCTAHAAG